MSEEAQAEAAAVAPAPEKTKPTISEKDIVRCIRFYAMTEDDSSMHKDDAFLVKNRDGQFYNTNGCWGYIDTGGDPVVMPFDKAVEFCNGLTIKQTVYICILRRRPDEGKQSHITWWLSRGLIEWLNAHPTNPIARANVMRIMGEMPPHDLDTFEKIKSWIEDKSEKSPVVDTASPASIRPVAPNRNIPAMDIEFRRSFDEFGHCRYSTRMVGRHDITISIREIEEFVDDGIDDWDSILDRIGEIASDNGNVNTDAGDYNYEEYEVDETENTEDNPVVGRAVLKDQLRIFIRTHNADLLDSIG